MAEERLTEQDISWSVDFKRNRDAVTPKLEKAYLNDCASLT